VYGAPAAARSGGADMVVLEHRFRDGLWGGPHLPDITLIPTWS
jgi:hypothetical protein